MISRGTKRHALGLGTGKALLAHPEARGEKILGRVVS